jgi:pimeloyl-ACP methyl ester carboxylesterase
MKARLLVVMASALLASGVLSTERVSRVGSQEVKNGTILEIADGFPCATYEQWLDQGRSQMVFDEARVRSQFPPEKFKENKDKLHIPAGTYEEWLAQLKRRSDAMQAKWPSIEAETRRTYPPEMFRDFKETVDCFRIVYASDGLKIAGFILKPRASASGRRPVVIYNHGGNSQIGSLDDTSLLRLSWLVRAGYVVIASQYRGCGGSEGDDEMGGADIDDVLNLIPLAESLPYADPARLGMLGWSRGGMMAFLALSKSCRISAAVIGSAPTDLFAEIEKRPAMESLLRNRVPGYAANKEAALKARSARFWPEKLCKTTPILLFQGSDDQRCVPESALDMGLQLQRSGHPFRLIFFESGSHGLSEHTEEVNRQTLLWLEKYLRQPTDDRAHGSRVA